MEFSNPSRFIFNSSSEKTIDESYLELIGTIVLRRNDIDDEQKLELNALLSTSPKLSIKAYKHYLRYNAEVEWEKDKSKNKYKNLSKKITDELALKPLDEFIYDNHELIETISRITSVDTEYLTYLFSGYIYAIRGNNIDGISKFTGEIKGLIKEFNAKVKEEFIRNYINENVFNIKKYYSINSKNSSLANTESDRVIKVMLESDIIKNSIRMEIGKYFNTVMDIDELEAFIRNVINRDDDKNYAMLNINYSPKFNLLQATKSFNRLNNNYLDDLRSLFSIDQIDLINRFINEKDYQKRKDMYGLFSISQRNLLLKIIPIMSDFNCTIGIENSNFVFNTDDNILNYIEEREVKKEYKIIEQYNNVSAYIFKNYFNVSRNISEIDTSVLNDKEDDVVLFTDDNYSLTEKGYLTNISKCVEIVNGIDKDALDYLIKNRNEFSRLKKLLINEGLLSSFLCDDNSNVTVLCDIINNFRFIKKSIDLSISNLPSIVKESYLCRNIDDFTRALLGTDVANKIVYNQQFLQDGNNPDNISLRLRKANDLMLRAESIDKSAVPYFEPLEYKGIKLIRYNNNNPRILTSGIDSNTCFKIDANDNDYLFYSILNKNGCVLYFEDDGKLCGRITAHLKNNCLMINGIRNIDNEYTANSLEKKERNEKLLKLVEMFADKMIELSSNNNCPIDYVVANKSGILESSVYNTRYPLVDNMFFRPCVDVYNEDFSEFTHLYDNCSEQFLKQVPCYTKGKDDPFTTDFGHYPLVMIKSRGNKRLERLWDVAYDSPNAIYKRNDFINIKRENCYLSDKEIDAISRINAINYYYNGGNPDHYVFPSFLNQFFDYVEITDKHYLLISNNNSYECHIDSGFDDVKIK